MFRIADELQAELKYSNNERINLEMSLLDMIAVKKAPSLSSIISRLEGAGRRPRTGTRCGGAAREERRGLPTRARQPERGTTMPARRRRRPAGQTRRRSKQTFRHWEDFLNTIKDSKQYLHCILKPSSVRLDGDTLHITYPGRRGSFLLFAHPGSRRTSSSLKRRCPACTARAIRVVIGAGVAGAGRANAATDRGRARARAEKKRQNRSRRFQDRSRRRRRRW